MATLHLMHGFIAAGKSTFARRLADETGALLLGTDRWMVRIFGHNPPAEAFQSWKESIRAIQWDIARHVLDLGGDVILDYGFWTRAGRDEMRARAAAIGVEARWYTAGADRAALLARALARNERLGAADLVIEQATFDSLWPLFEPLGADEPALSIASCEDSRAGR